MNKLQEILQEFDNKYTVRSMPEELKKEHVEFKKFFVNKMVEYAKSVTYNVRLEADKHQVTTRKILDRIDQDLLSLNKK